MAATISDVKAAALSAPTIAMLLTAYRVFERARRRKFGGDDALALLSAIMLLIFVVGMFVHIGNPVKISRTTAIALAYALPELFYGVLWSTRLSILFAIIRFTPDQMLRRILYGVAFAFFVCWATLFSQVFWVCEGEPDWKDAPVPQCFLGSSVAIAQLITDVFADATLIAFPVKLLWNLHVSKGHRIRLMLTFSSSIVTTIVSLVHAYYVLRVGKLDELVAAIVEISVSLIVCNTAVIVTAIMRLFRVGGEDGSHSRPSRDTHISGHQHTSKFNHAISIDSRGFTNNALKPKAVDAVELIQKHHLPDENQDNHFSSFDWRRKDGIRVTREQVVHLTPGQ